MHDNAREVLVEHQLRNDGTAETLLALANESAEMRDILKQISRCQTIENARELASACLEVRAMYRDRPVMPVTMGCRRLRWPGFLRVWRNRFDGSVA